MPGKNLEEVANKDLLDRFRQCVTRAESSPSSISLNQRIKRFYARALHSFSARSKRRLRLKAKTFWNDEMVVVFPEPISIAIFRRGYYEEGLTQMVLSYLKPGATFFDVGAHFGYFTMLAARVVGKTGQVHCFEPSPTNFRILRTNTVGKANIIASNVAVFSEPKQLRFNDYGLEHSAYSSVYSARVGPGSGDQLTPKISSVPAISLDSYVKQTGSKPDFIKIDAESSELEILKGLTETISICRPIISLEVGDVEGSLRPFTSRDIVLWLTERGYEAFQYRSGHISPHLPESRYSYDNLLFVPKM